MRFEWFRGDVLTRFAPHARILIPIFDAMWGNESITEFMRTGELAWRPTGPFRPVMWQYPDGAPPLDYVGLNFYSRFASSRKFLALFVSWTVILVCNCEFIARSFQHLAGWAAGW